MSMLKRAFGLLFLCTVAVAALATPGSTAQAAPGGILLSYQFEVGYYPGGGAGCRVLAVPNSTGGYWEDLLCGQNGITDPAGNFIEFLGGYFPQLRMNGNARYNEGTGVLTITYDDGRTETLTFNPAEEIRTP